MADYWISTFTQNVSTTGRGVAVDSLNNIISVGSVSGIGPTADNGFVTKYNQNGEVISQSVLGGTNTDSFRGVSNDYSGNIYICGYTNSAGAGNNDFLIAKYDSFLNIQWQRILGGAGSEIATSISSDSSGNIYVAGYTTSAGAGGTDILLAKYNSTGTIQWQRTLGSINTDRAAGLIADSSGNFYICGAEGATSNAVIAKYNSSGTLQWQRFLGPNATTINTVTIDSIGNICVGGNTSPSGNSDALVAKYNSSGTLQWQRILGGAGSEVINSISTDDNNNIYICGNTDSAGAGDRDFLIAKYDTSGNIQWQRVFGSSTYDTALSVVIDTNGDMCINGFTDGGVAALLLKLPSDGSLTGVYGPYTYAVSTLTASTSTLVDSAGSLTAGTPSLTAATSSLTSLQTITATAVE